MKIVKTLYDLIRKDDEPAALSGRFNRNKISRFEDIPDIATLCVACLQVSKKLYGGKYLRLCPRCAVSCGPHAYELMLNLSSDKRERCVQLEFMRTACDEFAENLINSPHALSVNMRVRKLLVDMKLALYESPSKQVQ